MVSSAAATVAQYLKELPAERRAVVSAVRDLVNRHLPPGYVEGMGYGMIGWVVPLSRYPDTYNRQPLCYAGLAAQKNGYSLYLMNVYADSEEERKLRAAYAAAGRKLDMGKCCLRFRSLDGLLADEVGRIIAATPVEQYIARYEAVKSKGSARQAAAKEATARGAAAKKTAPKKVVAKKVVAKKK